MEYSQVTESVDFNISGEKIGVTQPENLNKSKKSEKKKKRNPS